MKLKYYMRGLGTGIVVTALILGISSGMSSENKMTDEEILARAKQLGLVERTVLSDMAKDEESTTGDTIKEPVKEEPLEEETVQEEPAEGEAVKEEPMEEEAVKEEPTEEKTVQEEPVQEEVVQEDMGENTQAILEEENEDNKKAEEFGMPDESGTITVTIVKGDSSDSVSRRLEEAGLVDNAVSYDKYLCKNGYDKNIRVGNYEIPADATGEEIARIITGR